MSQATCPVCEESYTVQGLYGHLRKHDLHGDELRELYQQAVHEHDQALSEEEVPDQDDLEVTKLELDDEGNLNRRELGADEWQEAEADEPSDLPDAPTPQGQAKKDDLPNWERLLERLKSIRSNLKEAEQEEVEREHPFRSVFSNPRIASAKEGLDALDKIEVEIRSQIGSSGRDQELKRTVQDSLDRLDGLRKAYQQKGIIESRFDGEEAEQRAQQLAKRETEIRAEIRENWNVGDPISDLNSDDPLRRMKESTEDSGDSDGGVFGVGKGAVTRTFRNIKS